PRNRFGGNRNRAQTSPAYGIRSRRASAAKSTCLVINVTVLIIARSPHPTPKTALAPKAPRGSCHRSAQLGSSQPLKLEMFCRCFSFVRDFLIGRLDGVPRQHALVDQFRPASRAVHRRTSLRET